MLDAQYVNPIATRSASDEATLAATGASPTGARRQVVPTNLALALLVAGAGLYLFAVRRGFRAFMG